MKKENIFKALVIIVPVLIAVYASYTEHNKQNKANEKCSIENHSHHVGYLLSENRVSNSN